jgi:hypothetical protein
MKEIMKSSGIVFLLLLPLPIDEGTPTRSSVIEMANGAGRKSSSGL